MQMTLGGVLQSLASFPKMFVLALLGVEGIGDSLLPLMQLVGHGLPGLMITVLLLVMAATLQQPRNSYVCFDVSIKTPLEDWSVALW